MFVKQNGLKTFAAVLRRRVKSINGVFLVNTENNLGTPAALQHRQLNKTVIGPCAESASGEHVSTECDEHD
jgi:hypothetical protein